MRLGTIRWNTGYVVDLDNESMVDHAKQSIIEDIQSAVDNGVTFGIEPDKDNALSEFDIPEFLMEDGEDYLVCDDED